MTQDDSSVKRGRFMQLGSDIYIYIYRSLALQARVKSRGWNMLEVLKAAASSG